MIYLPSLLPLPLLPSLLSLLPFFFFKSKSQNETLYMASCTEDPRGLRKSSVPRFV